MRKLNGKYCVYLITNMVNGKQYVGQTGQGARKRWNSHKGDARRGFDLRFYHAIRKHGVENFVLSVLREGLNKEEADQEEVLAIRFLNLTDEKLGYNLMTGGAHSGHTESTRRKLSEKAFERRKDVSTEQMISLYQTDMSLVRIGEKFKMTHHSIARRLRSVGINIRPMPEAVKLASPLAGVADEAISQLYEHGVNSSVIADIFGADSTTIRARLVRCGTGVRPRDVAQSMRRGTGLTDEIAVRLYREGLSLPKIAVMFGVSHPAVRYRLKKAGEPRRTASEAARLRKRGTNEQRIATQ